jgi:hypothetical protein
MQHLFGKSLIIVVASLAHRSIAELYNPRRAALRHVFAMERSAVDRHTLRASSARIWVEPSIEITNPKSLLDASRLKSGPQRGAGAGA